MPRPENVDSRPLSGPLRKGPAKAGTAQGLVQEVHAAEEGVEAGVEAEEEMRVHR